MRLLRKQQRIEDSEQDLFNIPPESIDRHPRGLHSMNARWKPKNGKTEQSVGKVMASRLWHALGIIYTDYLEKRQSSTATII